MQSLRCLDNQLTSLDLSGLTGLQSLDCTNNKLAVLNLTGCTALLQVLCSSNRLTALDLSDCPLNNVDCRYNYLESVTGIGSTYISFTPQTTFTLTVDGGSGSGSFVPFRPKPITAGEIKGKTFERWEVTAGGATVADPTAVGTTIALVEANATVKAVYKSNIYTIQFNGNGATSGATAPVTATYGVSATFTANGFQKTGSTFTGWQAHRASDGKWFYINGSGATAWFALGQQNAGYHLHTFKDKGSASTLTQVDGDVITLHAQWANATYTIQFNGNGATSGATAPVTATYGMPSTFTANGFKKTGHTFTGWQAHRASDDKWFYINAESKTAWFALGQQTAGYNLHTFKDKGSASTLTQVSGDVITMHAQWRANTYTLRFDGNGATSGATASVTATYGVSATFTANGFQKTGGAFAGWQAHRASDDKWFYINAEGKTAWFALGEQSAGYNLHTFKDKASMSTGTQANGDTITLYAQWK